MNGSEEQPTPSNSKAKKKPKKPVKLTEEQIRASLMPLEFCFEQLRQERVSIERLRGIDNEPDPWKPGLGCNWKSLLSLG